MDDRGEEKKSLSVSQLKSIAKEAHSDVDFDLFQKLEKRKCEMFAQGLD